MRLITAGVVTFILAAGMPALAAQGRGKAKHGESGERASNIKVIGTADQRIIREWFSQPNNLNGLPPGLAKKETLPPGLQKQLIRNGKLPPGLQKKIQPMPVVLEERLTPLPEGTRRVVINGSIVLMDQRSNLILDIMAVF